MIGAEHEHEILNQCFCKPKFQ